MDSSSIELPGSEIDSIRFEEGTLTIHFSHAIIIKTMTGALERTKWRQRCDLIMGGAEMPAAIPGGKLTLAGGDVGENVYTYRDMIPIPLDSRGRVRCDLRFEGTDDRLTAEGESIRLEMIDTPKYIEHIRPEKGQK